ncbi:MAG: monovalent cation:proton antiporter-2 (CPA2) family protein [Pseudomonadota bacterium]
MTAIPPLYVDAMILLTGAVAAAPIFKRIGLGTVLGYVSAGVLIGPIFGFIGDADAILHFAELGVVMLLFLIGLELKPARLWTLRYDIFGMGALQVISCGIALSFLISLALDSFEMALIAGFGLALSSTAFAMQFLEDKGETNTVHGRKALAILLFQDIAIVPLLALLPLLSHRGDTGLGWTEFFSGIAAIALLILVGRYLLNPILRQIAKAGAREVMIAAALLLVFSAAMLMQAAGLSMALGAFIAGVLLAESSFRHEIEANIEPFRGLLLGLFFLAIGMSLNLGAIASYWYIILVFVPASMVVKAGLIYVSARLFGTGNAPAVRTAAVLTQHGEFAFVLFSAALSLGLVDREFTSFMIAAVILSMALTPLSVMLGERLISGAAPEELEEDFEGAGSPILMIGFSRMGQVTAQTLLAAGCEMTIIENDPDRIRSASDFGFRIYFGDGTRSEVLRAAGIEKANMVAILTARPDVTNRIVDLIQREWPDKRLYVRTYDRTHALEMMDKEVDYQLRETVESSLIFGGKMLEGLGLSVDAANDIVEDIRYLDHERLLVQRSEGMQAGSHMLHTQPVKPEPLIEPKTEGEGLDEVSREIVENAQLEDS